MRSRSERLAMAAHPVRAMLITLVLLLAIVPVLYRWDGMMEAEQEATAPPRPASRATDADSGGSNDTRANATEGNETVANATDANATGANATRATNATNVSARDVNGTSPNANATGANRTGANATRTNTSRNATVTT